METFKLSVLARLMDVALRKRPLCTTDEFEMSVLPEFKVEAERIMRDFPAILHASIDRRTLDIMIQGQQQQILDWMDNVIGMLPKREQKELNVINPVFGLPDCYKTLYSDLHKLLLFMQRHFTPYMNPDLLIPVFYNVVKDRSLKKNLRLIKRRLKDAAIDPAYWEFLRGPLDNLFVSNSGGHKVTYGDLTYLKKLYEELVILCSGDSEPFLNKLQHLLISLNFNDAEYREFILTGMKEEVEQLTSSHEKLLRLHDFRIKTLEVADRTDGLHTPVSVSLKTYLNDWITANIQSLEMKKPTSMKDVDPALLALEGIKFYIGISSYHFMYMLKVLVKIGWMKKPNKTELAKVIAYFIGTDHTAHLAEESIRKRYYNKSQPVKEAVTNLLADMGKFIKGNGLILLLTADSILLFLSENASVIGLTLALVFSKRSRYTPSFI